MKFDYTNTKYVILSHKDGLVQIIGPFDTYEEAAKFLLMYGGTLAEVFKPINP